MYKWTEKILEQQLRASWEKSQKQVLASFELADNEAPGSIFDAAVELFQEPETALERMTAPAHSLGNKLPIEFSGSQQQAEVVVQLLEAMKYGNFS